MSPVQYCIIPVSTCIQSDHAKSVKRTQAKLNVRHELNITLEEVAFDLDFEFWSLEMLYVSVL